MNKETEAGCGAVGAPVEQPVRPRFERTYCSQCGGEFGAGDNGFSHCDRHTLQGGMTNAQLTDAWCKKLPGVVPTERQMTAFAIGVEVGFERARDLERQDWSRVHQALAKHGEHPGRTDDHLAEVIDRVLAKLKGPNVI